MCKPNLLTQEAMNELSRGFIEVKSYKDFDHFVECQIKEGSDLMHEAMGIEAWGDDWVNEAKKIALSLFKEDSSQGLRSYFMAYIRDAFEMKIASGEIKLTGDEE